MHAFEEYKMAKKINDPYSNILSLIKSRALVGMFDIDLDTVSERVSTDLIAKLIQNGYKIKNSETNTDEINISWRH